MRDESKEPMELVNVSVEDTPFGTTTNTSGFFRLNLPHGQYHTVVFSFIGFEPQTLNIYLSEQETRIIDITLISSLTRLPDVEIIDRHQSTSNYITLNPRLTALIPGPGRSVERMIMTMPGVSTTSELSTQYSVRGGNFDENLVYVNGIEIYRPFLVRSGQQEGLSFVNPELVSSINFSAGGFDAQHGDKMSSVLDIQYRRPEEFGGSFSISLLEGSLHLEDVLLNNRLRYIFGLRHKSNQYLLGTLDTKGNYAPDFTDVQTLISYDLNPLWELSFLGNISRNQFLFRPQTQTTRFGTATEVRQFTVYFQGQERTNFLTGMGALSLNFRPTNNQSFQLITSVFQTDETENFDILGQYLLERVDTDFGSSNFGQPMGDPLGVGSFLNHARNYLNAIVWNIEHKAHIELESSSIKWGIRYRYEDIFDRLNEWTMIDSAGYTLPRYPAHTIRMQDTVSANITLQSSRLSGFVQNSWRFQEFTLTAGLRASYWSVNDQLILSPRATLRYNPHWAPRLVLRASTGLYKQPPFYRELRDLNGRLNKNIRAQESLQFVLGAQYDLYLWDRPFRYTCEIYYKHFTHLIPYELNNVRIRYFAENSSRGYGTGIDMKLNGEFVPGIESWASLSVMKTEELIQGAYYINPDGVRTPLGFIPRPTDQRVNFSLFFQDFLPRNPSYKVNLALFYGSGLPVNSPTRQKINNPPNMPPYRRVDIGFSKEIIGPASKFRENSPFRHFESMWLTAEVLDRKSVV